MRKLLLLLPLLLAVNIMAAQGDDDGILGAAWDAPATGNTPTGYELSYTVNGVLDSITTNVSELQDSSTVLIDVGDWAVLNIRSYYDYWSEYDQQIIREFSMSAVSDTVVYTTSVYVNPPTGIRWE